jgi:hypothetical protein
VHRTDTPRQLQHPAAAHTWLAHVITDQRQIFRVGLSDGVKQVHRRTRHAETANDEHVA